MATIGLYVDPPKQLDPAISFEGALQQVALERIRRAVLSLDIASLPVQIKALLDFPLELGRAVEHSHVLGHFNWPSDVILALGDYSRVGIAQYSKQWMPAAAQQRQREIRQEALILVEAIKSTFQALAEPVQVEEAT